MISSKRNYHGGKKGFYDNDNSSNLPWLMEEDLEQIRRNLVFTLWKRDCDDNNSNKITEKV